MYPAAPYPVQGFVLPKYSLRAYLPAFKRKAVMNKPGLSFFLKCSFSYVFQLHQSENRKV